MTLFKELRPAPLWTKVSSRDSCAYFYRSMAVIGWLPPKEGPRRWLYIFYGCLMNFCGFVYMPAGLVLKCIFEFSTLSPNKFLSLLQVLLNMVGNWIKSGFMFSQIWRLQRINELIEQLDEHCVTSSQRSKLHQMVARCNQIVFFYTGIYTFLMTSGLFASLYNGRTPMEMYHPMIDSRDGTGSMLIASFIEYVVTFIVSIQELQSDTYPVIFTTILRGSLDILKDRIENLHKDHNLSPEQHYQELAGCIKDHKIILQCCDLLRPLVSVTTFSQFMLISLVLAIAIISINIFGADWKDITNHASFAMAILMDTFPFCWNCELLVADCEAVSNALFHSNWVEANSRYKSTLVTFLLKAQQPIRFMAGAIFPINLHSNITVAKFAFSIITIVNNMNVGEKFKDN